MSLEKKVKEKLQKFFGLFDKNVFFTTFLFILLYILHFYFFTKEGFLELCFIEKKDFLCKLASPSYVYYSIPFFIFFILIVFHILAFFGQLKNDNKVLRFYNLIIIPLIVSIFFIFKINTIPYKNGMEPFFYLSLIFWCNVTVYFLLVFRVLIFNGDFKVQKKEKTDNKVKGGDYNTAIINSIKTSLPGILNKIFSGSNFKRITLAEDGNLKKGLFDVKDISFEDSTNVFVELKLHADLIDSISTLSSNDWTLGINTNGMIRNFEGAKWRSKDGKNGLLIQVKENTIDFKDTYEFPHLFEKSPLLKKHLDFCIGKSIKGDDMVYDLAGLPHLLVASETGGGKSVSINNMLISFMKSKLNGSPIEFIIVDPKRVEFGIFKGLPGFRVETNLDRAVNLVNWAVAEMDRRYLLLEDIGLKKIDQYHERGGKMNYIVFIIDEFADIMTIGGEVAEEFEYGIKRLTQLARAIGIHIILATQNPIKEVLTSNIKANMTSRLGLRTSDGIKSRTIIDDDILASIKFKGEGYIKTGERGLEHLKSYYIDNDDLPKFIEYYKEEYKKKFGGVTLQEEKNNIDLNKGVTLQEEKNNNSYNNILISFEEYIKENNSNIDVFSYSYAIFRYLVENNGYKNREELANFCKGYGVTYDDVKKIIANLREKEFVVYNESQKMNIIFTSLEEVKNNYLEDLFNSIYSIVGK